MAANPPPERGHMQRRLPLSPVATTGSPPMRPAKNGDEHKRQTASEQNSRSHRFAERLHSYRRALKNAENPPRGAGLPNRLRGVSYADVQLEGMVPPAMSSMPQTSVKLLTRLTDSACSLVSTRTAAVRATRMTPNRITPCIMAMPCSRRNIRNI